MSLKHLQQHISLIKIYCKSVFRKESPKVNIYFVFILSLISSTYDQIYFTTQAPDANDTSVTLATRTLHECYTNNTSATWVKNVDVDNGTSENIFSQPYIYYDKW